MSKHAAGSLLLVSALLPLPSMAQQVPSGGAMVLEEIIVTARKREESLQDVPLAITAFGAQAMVHRDIRNLEDVASNTVGVTYLGGSTSGYQAAPTIRGLSSGFLQDRIQNVAVFLDGVYLQRQSMMNMGLMDLARVEVVKGPQNSLYGHSAFAGAINYVTQKPTDQFDAYLSTVQGDDDRSDFNGAIAGPLIGDTLLGRIGFGISEYDGGSKNHHPYAGADPSGFNNQDNLGGWDDESYSAALTWNATDALEFGASWYKADLKRENQPNYVIGGLLEVGGLQISRYDDMNFNEMTMFDPNSFQTFVGHTMWQGELPYRPGPGTCINDNPFLYPCPEEDLRSSDVVVDPRGYGFVADTEVISLNMRWEISDDYRLTYLYGDVEHSGSTAGPAERDPLRGATLLDPDIFGPTGPQFVDNDSNISSARPITELDMSSHELRLDWLGTETLSASAGLYYSETEDSQHDLTIFAPVCSDRDSNGNGSSDDERANCETAYVDSVADTPLNDACCNPFALFSREFWNGEQGNLTDFRDEMTAVFGSIDWVFADDWNLRLEGRYTWEDREIHRRTDGFALAVGETGCIDSPIMSFPFCFTSTIRQEFDDETFSHFAPRATVEWTPGDDLLFYGTVAKGIKSGGFNNAESPEQQSYDEEENLSFELGSKTLLADGSLLLNASLYYIDWSDMLGSEPPQTSAGNILNGASVIGNMGDVQSYGLELESSWSITNSWSIDAGLSLNSAEFESGTQYDPAQRYYYYQCEQEQILNGDYCGNTEVGGNKVPRNSERQYLLAINYLHEFSGGWQLRARVDANYQSRQYITPLNQAYIPSRTLTNASLILNSPEHWEINAWVKNLADEEYVAGVILVAEQSKLIVSHGAPRAMGMGVRYNF